MTVKGWIQSFTRCPQGAQFAPALSAADVGEFGADRFAADNALSHYERLAAWRHADGVSILVSFSARMEPKSIHGSSQRRGNICSGDKTLDSKGGLGVGRSCW